MPFRVVPEINNYIKSLKGSNDNVFIIDPSIRLNQSINAKEYMSYFVDFQHPSTKGHAIIAEQLLNKISPMQEFRIQVHGFCDASVISNVKETIEIKPNILTLESALNTSTQWLSKFEKINSYPYLHKYYLDLIIEKERLCL